MKRLRNVMGFVVLATVFGNMGTAWAVDTDIQASAQLRQALSLTNVIDMDYGIIEYSSSAAANDITLSSVDGSISCTDNTNYNCPASGVQGSATVSGQSGQIVQISCATTGAISNGSNSFNLSNTKFHVDGSTTSCAGLGTSPVSYSLTGNSSNDVVRVGADLNITSAGVPSNGIYNTSNSGGTPVALRVVYQ